MLHLAMSDKPHCRRRDFLKIGALSTLGIALPDLLRARAQAGSRQPQARACIVLWMGGGPSHVDTFDPKPDAPVEYRGPFRTQQTCVPGVTLCEHLPLLAREADKFSILRSVTHPSPSHEIANHIMLTGNVLARGTVSPSYGAVVYRERGMTGALPPYVSIPGNPPYADAGYLGGAYRPFAVGNDPSSPAFNVRGLSLPGSLSVARVDQRRNMLDGLDTLHRQMDTEEQFRTLDSFYQRSYEMITSPQVRTAFDLTRESPRLRDRYGRNTLGQSCILARRLIESGVSFVHVDRGGWDTHNRNFETLASTRLPELDRAFSALLGDLAARGLLDSTIVLWMGEFGRTPKIDWSTQWQGGRHHWSKCFSAVVAGGGFKGGCVLGASNRLGEEPHERPILPWDIGATLLGQLGIPYDKTYELRGRNLRLLPFGTSVVSGGLLNELL